MSWFNLINVILRDCTGEVSYSQDFVEAMWLILQQETPRDYVVSTGVQHSVRQFVEAAFHVVGISLECARRPLTSLLRTYCTLRQHTVVLYSRSALVRRWRGSGKKEEGVDKASGRVVVRVNPAFYRADVRPSARCPSFCLFAGARIRVDKQSVTRRAGKRATGGRLRTHESTWLAA